MCFLLFAGTTDPIPRKAWIQESPDISVQDLKGDEAQVCLHFSKPSVQNIGSTSYCGCDFPSAIYQNGGWPEIEYRETGKEQQDSEHFNREALATLLSSLSDDWVELYGVWAGDYAELPAIREEIVLADLRDRHFCFKERSLYRVHLH